MFRPLLAAFIHILIQHVSAHCGKALNVEHVQGRSSLAARFRMASVGKCFLSACSLCRACHLILGRRPHLNPKMAKLTNHGNVPKFMPITQDIESLLTLNKNHLTDGSQERRGSGLKPRVCNLLLLVARSGAYADNNPQSRRRCQTSHCRCC